jgi:tetratricopeptide (TPR) repeat protein
MAVWTGREARALRVALRMSVETFAEHLGVGVRTVAHWDAKRSAAKPFPAMQEVLDAALDRATPAQQLRFELLVRRPAPGTCSCLHAPEGRTYHPGSTAGMEDVVAGRACRLSLNGEEQDAAASRPEGDEDVNRRQMLAKLGVLGLATTFAGAETVRQGLAATLPDQPGAADDWEEVVDGYGRAFYVVPTDRLLRDLTADLSVLRQGLERADNASRPTLAKAAGQLSAISAAAWAGAGEMREARRWWRTARGLTDRSGDTGARVWVRGWEVTCGLYEERSIPAILGAADQATPIAGGRACAGTAGLYAGLAQTLAVAGRREEALAALGRVADVTDRIPAAVVADEDSMFGWPEVRLRHTESYVYTWLGDIARAYAAQDAALRLYPQSLVRDRAKMLLHRAGCMIREGDVGGGLSYAAQVLDDLPATQYTEGVSQIGRAAMRFLPPGERSRRDAVDLRARLAPAATYA